MAKQQTTSSIEIDRDGTGGADPLWYKDAIIYQLHVRAFFDSDNDGIGDFAGLTQKLDYLQELGVTALWLLPFYPSPLRDDGYDIANYTNVHPAYGDLRSFKIFLREAHARSLRVVTELVLNHTSDQHPWFQRARRAKPGSPLRDFYVWSDTPEKYREARIIFKDFEVSNWSWDPLAKAYYWHRFYAHQPDLNFDNPRVRQVMLEALDYWLGLGVDGLRLDAVPYLYEREGTNCENLPETHNFLKELRRHVDERFPGRMLLAEANQWPEDAIAYFGAGDECQTAFHFPVMPRLFMAIHMEDRYPIVDILHQTPAIPADCQWIVFLRNHDELTLEMVTDEERDYMYRVYARDRQARINLGIRRRLAPLLDNDRRKIELMNGLLCSLPGTPVIYYGDEIGMGDNIYLGDRHGVRTPMQWSPDRNAGFSGANPQRLYSPVIIDSEYLFATVNVENQQKNPHSLLWWMKRLIALRQHYTALGRGSLELLAPENPKILAFTREHGEESVLVVANLSRLVQFVELDLSRFAGRRPLEVFGQTRFPTVGKTPYMLTLSPYGFYWFALEPTGEAAQTLAPTNHKPPRLNVHRGLGEVIRGRLKKGCENLLARELANRAWFGHDAPPVQNLQISDSFALGKGGDRDDPSLLMLDVEYLEGESQKYAFPLGAAWGREAESRSETTPGSIVGPVQKLPAKEPGILFDASQDVAVAGPLLDLMVRRRRIKGLRGELAGRAMPGLTEILETAPEQPVATATGSEPNGSMFVFGDKLVLTLFRGVASGVHPAWEMGLFFEAHAAEFPHTVPLLGSLEYRSGEDSYMLGVLHKYVAHTTTAWQYSLDALGRYFEHVMSLPPEARQSVDAPRISPWDLASGDATSTAKDLLGGMLEWAALLGQRTGELHATLAAETADANFAAEPITLMYQRSLYQSLRKLALQTLHQLRGELKSLPAEIQTLSQAVLDRDRQVLDVFRSLIGQKIAAPRIRCHGDYDLRNVLYTGKDFLIVNFDGNPLRALATRRIKRSPLEDLAAVVHSFRAAASEALARLSKTGVVTPDAATAWRQAADFWHTWATSALLRAYLLTPAAELLPKARPQLDLLWHVHLLAREIAQLQFELDHHPDQAQGPLERILDLLAQ